VKYGASALGFVSSMPSGPGPIPEEMIAQLVSHVPEGIASFLLTSKQDADSIIKQLHRTFVTTVQLVDAVDRSVYASIRKELPHISIVQVIHVVGESSVTEAKSVEQYVDCLLLDSGNPGAPVKELGGTGRVHDWTISKNIVESVQVPVYLAGGLHADNVKESIDIVHPFGVDVCSGVRSGGKLDEEKLQRFFAVLPKRAKQYLP
jgi:phosphoribosylanthranilate isomerase